jgi:catechol 2,3-dioxygenase-like lactoylglutathione lyase family enzyme
MSSLVTTPDQLLNAYDDGHLSRRQLVAQLLAIGAATAASPVAARGAADTQPSSTFSATGIDHIALSVTDVRRSSVFYQQHLGLTLTRDGGDNSAFLNCGSDFLALFRGDRAGLHHFSFSIPNYDPDDAVKRLEAVRLKPRRESNRVYFPDPDNLTVQVSATRRARQP